MTQIIEHSTESAAAQQELMLEELKDRCEKLDSETGNMAAWLFNAYIMSRVELEHPIAQQSLDKIDARLQCIRGRTARKARLLCQALLY